jgi:hypothetical protein
MKSRQGYKGYVIEARSCELRDGGFSAWSRLKNMMRAAHAEQKPQPVGNLCSCICRLLILPFLFGSSLLFASAGSFIGPGGGGSFFEPTVSSLDPNRVLVACDMTDGYFSETGGKSWRSFNLRGRIGFFAFDPNNANVLYAKSIGLWRSPDAGITWSLIYPDPRDVTEIEMHGDHAGENSSQAHADRPFWHWQLLPGTLKLSLPHSGTSGLYGSLSRQTYGKPGGITLRSHRPRIASWLVPRRVSRFLTSTLSAKYPWLPACVKSGSKSALRLAQKNYRM